MSSTHAKGPDGVIYDLGYQRYEGDRLGRRQVVFALFAHSLRAAFGIGRGGRAKVAPLLLLAITVLPSLIAIAIRSVTKDAAQGLTHDDYLLNLQIPIALFVASQCPELVGRDQRHRVLSLYFSRPMLRTDYVVAKLGAMVAAVLILVLLPQLVLSAGHVLSGKSVPGAFGDELRALPAVLVNGVAHATLLASVGLALAAFTPRRAYATGSIIAAYTVAAVVSGIILDIRGANAGRYAVLLNPFSLLDGLRTWLFGGVVDGSPVRDAALSGPIYGLAYLVLLGLALVVLFARYRRVQA